jgi:hypothetical protein
MLLKKVLATDRAVNDERALCDCSGNSIDKVIKKVLATDRVVNG